MLHHRTNGEEHNNENQTEEGEFLEGHDAELWEGREGVHNEAGLFLATYFQRLAQFGIVSHITSDKP